MRRSSQPAGRTCSATCPVSLSSPGAPVGGSGSPDHPMIRGARHDRSGASPTGPQRPVAVPMFAIGSGHSAVPAVVERRPGYFDLDCWLERVTPLGHVGQADYLEEVVPHRCELASIVVARNLDNDAAGPRARAIRRKLNVPIRVVHLLLHEADPARDDVNTLLGLTARLAPGCLRDRRR